MRKHPILSILAVLIGLAVLGLIAFVATFDANRYKPQLTTLVEDYTGRKLSITGDLRLSLWPRLSLSMGKAALSQADGQGEAVRFDSGHLAVALRPLLSRTLVIEGLTLHGLRADLTAPAPGGTWRIEDAVLKTGRIASGAPDRLSLDGQVVSPDGDTRLALTLASRYLPDFAARTLTLDDFGAQLQGKAGRVEKLTAFLGLNLVADLAARRAEASALTVEASAVGGPRLAMAGKGHAALAEGTASVTLSGTLDESKIRLDADASQLSPLALHYELSANQIDADRLHREVMASLGPAPEAGAAVPAAAGTPAPAATEAGVTAAPGAVPSSPLGPLSAIAGVDTQGSLAVQRLRLAGLTFDALQASAQSGADKFAIDLAGAKLNAGTLQGRLSMDTAGPRVQAKLAGVDAGDLLRDATGRDMLDGRGDVQLDLTASGLESRAWGRTLAGNASFSLREGTVKGMDLSRVMQQVSQALGGRVALEDRAKALERTPFSSFTGALAISSGVARTDNLDLKADWVHATGAGQANLEAGTVDMLIRAAVTGAPPGAPASGALGEIVAKLRGVTVPVHVTGRFDDLHYKVDVQDLAADAVKRELTRRLGEKLGVPLPGAASGGKPGSGARSARGGKQAPGDKHGDPVDRLRQLLKR